MDHKFSISLRYDGIVFVQYVLAGLYSWIHLT